MLVFDYTCPDLHTNLALDEALLLQADEGGPAVLRLWEWPTPAVVLGASGRLAEEVNEAACIRDGVPLARRASGGGTVLLGRGCLLYSLILPYDVHPALADINASYRFLLSMVAELLQDLAPGLEHAGTSDLACAGRKCSGNAQQRKRHAVLHHGTLLYDFPLDAVALYLGMPPRQPEYRRRRPHADFLMNLSARRTELARRFSDVLPQKLGVAARTILEPDGAIRDRAQALVPEKYEKREWIWRR